MTLATVDGARVLGSAASTAEAAGYTNVTVRESTGNPVDYDIYVVPEDVSASDLESNDSVCECDGVAILRGRVGVARTISCSTGRRTSTS